MTRTRIALLGAIVSAALVTGIGAVRAQDYYGVSDDGAYQREYDRAMGRDRVENGVESVIVRPYYDDIQKQQVIGRVDGEINPTAYSLSRPVDFSDLDLANPADRAELRIRVHETAQDLCAGLDDRVPQLRGDASADRECVRTATRNALRDVYG
jgi:UrcA family protein